MRQIDFKGVMGKHRTFSKAVTATTKKPESTLGMIINFTNAVNVVCPLKCGILTLEIINSGKTYLNEYSFKKAK